MAACKGNPIMKELKQANHAASQAAPHALARAMQDWSEKNRINNAGAINSSQSPAMLVAATTRATESFTSM